MCALGAGDDSLRASVSYDGESPVAVMVRFTLKTDESTYQSLHAQMLSMARPAGMLFHSSHTVGDQVGIVDFWPSEDAWGSVRGGTTGRGHEGRGDRSSR